jgi:hypothetical protein
VCLSALCRNIVDFIGAGEVKAGEVPGAFACEFVVQVCLAIMLDRQDCLDAQH